LCVVARLDGRVRAEAGGARRPGGAVDLAELSHRVAERYGGARVAVMAEAPDASAAAAAADRRADDDAGAAVPDSALAYLVPGDRDELDRLLLNPLANPPPYPKPPVTPSPT